MTQPMTPVQIWAVGILLIAFILNGSGAILYTSYVDSRREAEEREADRRWCSLMSTLDDRYSKLTPENADQAKLFADIKEIRNSLDCRSI